MPTKTSENTLEIIPLAKNFKIKLRVETFYDQVSVSSFPQLLLIFRIMAEILHTHGI